MAMPIWILSNNFNLFSVMLNFKSGDQEMAPNNNNITAANMTNPPRVR